MVLNRSWPAVSQICSLIHLLSSRIFLILKSILQAVWEGEIAFLCYLKHSDRAAGREGIFTQWL